MPSSSALRTDIQGWGADLDPNLRPGNQKEKTPVNGTGAHWDKPEQQIPKVKIFVSTEHKGITPVFGTSCPPKGLSGLIRKYAYTYSEGKKVHWLLLLFADRVNVAEGVLSDLVRGELRSPFSDKGLKSELKYNGLKSRFGKRRADTKRWQTQIILLSAIGAATYLVFRPKKENKKVA